MRNPIRAKNLNPRFLPWLLLGAVLLFFHPPRPSAFSWALPLIGAGLIVRSWGAGHLVKSHALTRVGPYAHLRHPLYAGTLLIASGFALLPGGWISLALLAGIWGWFVLRYLPRKERSESARLEALHGDAFVRYRRGVPALWPRLSPWRDPHMEDPSESPWSLARYSDNNELGTVLAVGAALILFWVRALVAVGA